MTVSKSRKKPPAKRPRAKKATPNGGGGVALYHVVKENETFDDAAEMLLQIVQKAARDHPGTPRHLYLDVDGHRNEAGGWDDDMFELKAHFIPGYLGQWLTSFSSVHSSDRLQGRGLQREDVPDHLIIREGGPSTGRKAMLARDAKAAGLPVFDSETGNTVNPDGTITEGL